MFVVHVGFGSRGPVVLRLVDVFMNCDCGVSLVEIFMQLKASLITYIVYNPPHKEN